MTLYPRRKCSTLICLALPVLVSLVASTAAHAQGTVDVSGVTAAMGTIEKSCLLGGSLAVVLGIVFGVFKFMGRDIAGGFRAICGGLFAGIVIGFAPRWLSSLTGQNVTMVITHGAKGPSGLNTGGL